MEVTGRKEESDVRTVVDGAVKRLRGRRDLQIGRQADVLIRISARRRRSRGWPQVCGGGGIPPMEEAGGESRGLLVGGFSEGNRRS